MGNYKLRLSDMMPNAWFYKLKDMSKPGKPQPPKKTPPIQNHQQYFIQHRNSYYFTSTDSFRSSSDKLYNSPINPKVSDVHFPEPPRKSSKTHFRRRPIKSDSKLMSSSVSADCSCRNSISSVWANTNFTPDSSPETNFHRSHACESARPSCKVASPPTDIIIDVENSTRISSFTTPFDGLDPIPELELPPILTKPPPKFNEMVSDIKNREVDTIKHRRTSAAEKIVQENTVRNLKQHRVSPRCSAISPGVKIRASSPKIASKKIQAYSRKSTPNRVGGAQRKRVAESFAIVKSSFNPQRDFKESMVEMIVENNIRTSKDLEDLLACYLTLNSNEYHDLIVRVFEQIWFDLADLHL